MGELSRSLRRQADGGFSHGNPLVAIGISSQVLDLGLVEDELFDYIIKDVARRLVLRFHTDVKDFSGRQDIDILRGKISEIYRQLQDRKIFNKALAEFRNMKSEERNETRVLRRALENTKQLLDSYRAQELALSQGTKQLAHNRELFDREDLRRKAVISEFQEQINRLMDEVGVIPSLEADIRQLKGKIERYEQKGISIAERGNKEIERLQERYQQKAVATAQRHSREIDKIKEKALSVNTYKELLRYFSYLGSSPTLLDVPVFDAQWVAFVTLVPAGTKEVTLLTRKGKWARHFRRDVSHHVPRLARKQILERWKAFLKKFSVLEEGETSKTHIPRLHVLELRGGRPRTVYGSKKFSNSRVLGCVPGLSWKVTKYHLAHQMIGAEDFYKLLTPFLVPGGLMVSQKTHRTTVRPSMAKLPAPTSWESKRLILGAG